MNKQIFIALGLIFCGSAGAQTATVELNNRAGDADYTKMMMVTNVFALLKDSVANPLDLASATPGDPTYWKKVVPPLMKPGMRRGFAWIFGGTHADDFAPHHTLILIENPGWTAYQTLIWTDRNHNYDLTDDGPPDTMLSNRPAVISLDERPRGFKVSLEHFPDAKFPQFVSMNDKAMGRLQGNRLFMGTSSSFRERRMNVLAGSWANGSDSFAVAVKDVNCNGIYNDEGIDQVMITDPGLRFENLQAVIIDNGIAYLEWDNAAFTVSEIHSDGRSLKLKRDTNAVLKYSLNAGSRLPRFRYCMASKPAKRRGIRRLKGKYTYIYIWHDQSPVHIADSAALHALGRLKRPDFQVLSLNYGASGRYIYRYNTRFDTELLQGFSSNELNRKLKVRKIPTGILVDRKQRIVAAGIEPQEVKSRLP